MKCPKCGSEKCIPISYGYPSPGWEEKVAKGEFVLGGCVVEDDSPEWECSNCHTSFGRSHLLDVDSESGAA